MNLFRWLFKSKAKRAAIAAAEKKRNEDRAKLEQFRQVAEIRKTWLGERQYPVIINNLDLKLVERDRTQSRRAKWLIEMEKAASRKYPEDINYIVGNGKGYAARLYQESTQDGYAHVIVTDDYQTTLGKVLDGYALNTEPAELHSNFTGGFGGGDFSGGGSGGEWGGSPSNDNDTSYDSSSNDSSYSND